TTDLHVSAVYPSTGWYLMKQALLDWPIRFAIAHDHSESPEVSFIIGHRGLSRVRHLLTTIQTIAAQRNVSIECIVVEQDSVARLQSLLPTWVQYVHAPLEDASTPFSRSSAFNAGAKLARASLVILHDGDMLVPCDYTLEAVKRFKEGYEVMQLKRF